MSLRGVIHGRTIELEQDPHLPNGCRVEVHIQPLSSSLFDHLRHLWHLEQIQPLPSLEEARQLVAQGLPPKWASQQVQAMREE